MNDNDGAKIISAVTRPDLAVTTTMPDGTQRELMVEVKFIKSEAMYRYLARERHRFVHTGVDSSTVLSEKAFTRYVAPKRRPHDPLNRFIRLVDLVPMPGMRKKLRKFVADERHDILELHRVGRKRPAQWREGCAWVYGIGYIFAYPIAALVLALIKKMYTGS